MNVDIAPILPLWLIASLGGLFLLTTLARLRAAPVGALVRLLAGAAAMLFLLSPEHIRQTFERLPDQALILVDESASMTIGERARLRDETARALETRLQELGVETVFARFGGPTESDIGDGLSEGLAASNRPQLGAVFVLSDGQVTGVEQASGLDLAAPLHGLLIAAGTNETDRRISWVKAPRFALVGEDLQLEFRVDDTTGQPTMPVTLRVDGEDVLTRAVPTGQDVTIDLPAARPGTRLVEIGIPSVSGELTTRNNAISARVNVIRDRLRVLLISGEPHAGERVWRNVLKSDPAVDLVHFTILKPAEKLAAAAPEDLNLIPFPSRELFLDKLQHFNVVIFDRYTYRGVISSFELAEVARFVDEGGAVLIAAGPELLLGGSLTEQPNLSYILPTLPTGAPVEGEFVPSVTETGQRHPITATLEGGEDWGRWLRVIPSTVRRGTTLMSAENDMPLLVTDRVGEGRVAMLLSDHLWLWARGFDGGGPHREFLRRLVHWLMAEPELEEEALSASLSEDGTLSVERQSLAKDVALVQVEADGAAADAVTLEDQGSGRFSAQRPGVEADRVRLTTTTEDGRVLTAAAVRERGATSEYSAVTVSAEALRPLASATGGAVVTIDRSAGQLPALRAVGERRTSKSGRGWLGVAERQARNVLSEERAPFLPRWAYLLLSAGFLLLAWLIESGRLLPRRDGFLRTGEAVPEAT